MGTMAVIACGIAVAALLSCAVVTVVLTAALRRERARADGAEADLVAQAQALTERVNLMESALATQTTSPQGNETADFVITRAGESDDAPGQVVRTDLVLGAAVGGGLVKTAALAHGVRRALTPEVRNRVRFEYKRHAQMSRKERKREQREALRRLRAERAQERRAAKTATSSHHNSEPNNSGLGNPDRGAA